TQRAGGQQVPGLRIVVDHVHLLATTLSEPEVSKFQVRESWLILFTYTLQHSASRRSAISSSENRGCSCSLTIYNTQRAGGQQVPRPRIVVDPVHLLATTLSEPEVSNFLVGEWWLVLFTYYLQQSASRRSAISSSENRGWSCSLTSYNT